MYYIVCICRPTLNKLIIIINKLIIIIIIIIVSYGTKSLLHSRSAYAFTAMQFANLRNV